MWKYHLEQISLLLMIKSVVSAMPNYVISYYRLSKAVIKKITEAIAYFWWSSGGNKKYILVILGQSL